MRSTILRNIVLVLFILLFAASVSADIMSVSLKGSTGSRFIKSGNSVNVNVIVYTDGSPVLPNQVEMIFRDKQISFSRCTQFTSENTNSLTSSYIGAANCTGSLGTVTLEDSTVEKVKINLYTADRTLFDSKDVNLMFDVNPPGISAIEPILSGSMVVGLRLTLNDTACSESSCLNKCSGLKSVQLFEGRTFSTLLNSSTLDGSCSGSVDVLVGSVFGANDISIKVLDALGNEGKDIYFWNPSPELNNIFVSGDFGYIELPGSRGQVGYIRGVKSSEKTSKAYLLDSLVINVLARKGSTMIYGNEFEVLIDNDETLSPYFFCKRLNNVESDDLLGFYNCTATVFNYLMDDDEADGTNHVLTVRFLTDTGDEEEQANENYIEITGNLKFDSEFPDFINLNATASETNGNNYTITIDASDSTGLSKVELYDGVGSNVPFRTLSLGNQRVVSDFAIDNVFFVYDGVKTIVVRVYDSVGNYVDKIIYLEFDNMPPEPAGSYQVYSSLSFNKYYKFVSSFVSLTGYIGFEIDDVNDISITSFDASGITIHPVKSRQYADLSSAIVCEKTGSKKFCHTTKDVELMVVDLNKASINITVEDSLGNSNNFILTPGFGLDIVDPVPTSLEVGFCSDDFGCFVGDAKPNPIYVDIDEEDAGFEMSYCFKTDAAGRCTVYGRNVRVDVSSWSGNPNEKSVLSDCYKSSDSWKCSGSFGLSGTVSENVSKMSYVAEVRDDSGNFYRGMDAPKTLSYGDHFPPEIKSFIVRPLGGGDGISGGDGIHVRAGDYFRVEAMVIDLSPPTMKLDVTNLLPVDKTVSGKYYVVDGEPRYLVDGDCEYVNSTPYSTGVSSRLWKCTWESDEGLTVPVAGDYAFVSGIKYNITDAVGHFVDGVDLTDIYLIAENEGDLLAVTVDNGHLSPGYLNRKMLSFVPARVSVPYAISKTGAGQYKLLSQRFLTCDILNNADDNNSPFYLERDFDEVFFLPYQFFSDADEPTLGSAAYKTKFNMKTALNENDRINEIASIDLNCDLAVYFGYVDSSGRKFMYKDPEVHNFTWAIDLKDSLNEPGAKIWEEIVTVNNSWMVQQAWIYQTQEILSIATKTCNLIEDISDFLSPITDVMALWSSVNTLLEPLSEAPVIGSAVGIIYNPSKLGYDAVDGFVGKAVTFVNEKVFNLGIGEGGMDTNTEDTGSDRFVKSTDDGQIKPIATLCHIVKCSYCDEGGSWGKGDEDVTDGFEKVGESIGVEVNVGAADWKESFLTSVSCGCLPGIVSKLQEYRQVECGYMTCLYEKSTMGMSVSECKVDRAQMKCKYITGEISQLGIVRGMDAMTEAMAGLVDSLAPPDVGLELVYGLVGMGCEVLGTMEEKNSFFQFIDASLCKLPAAINNVQQTIDLFNSTISSMATGEYWEDYLDGINPLSVNDMDECDPWVNSDFFEDDEEEE